MIFKTFDSDIDKISAKWGIFGKSFNDIGNAIVGRIKDINNGFQATDDLLGSFKDTDSIWKRLYPSKETIQSQMIDIETLFPKRTDEYFSSLLNGLTQQQSLIDKTKGSWTDYFNNLGEGEKWQVEFVQNTNLQKASLNDVKKAYYSARDGAIAHNAALKQQTPSAKAGEVALKGLAIAGNMIAFWAISKVLQVATEKITELANASEIAEEKATSFANSVNNATKDLSSNFSTLSSLNDEYQKLSKGVNALGENVSLSTDEYSRYKEIVQQISDIMPNMTSYFNAQGEKIAFAKGELSDLNADYEEYIQKQAKEFLVNGDEDGNKLQDALDNFGNNSQMGFWEGLKNTIKNLFGSYDMNDVPVDTMISTLEALRNKSKEEMIAYLNDVDLSENGEYLQTESNRAKVIAQDMISDTFGDINKLTDEQFDNLQETIANNIESLQNSNDVDMSAITSGLLQAAYSKDDFWAVGEDIRNDITTMLSSIDADTWKSLGKTEQSDVENFVGQLITAISSNKDGITDAWNGLFSPDLETLPVSEYVAKVNSYMDVIADVLGLDEEGKKNLMISLGFDIDTSSATLNGVKKKLDSVGDKWADTLNVSDLEIVASDEFDQALKKQKKGLNGAALSADDYAAALQSVKDAQNNTNETALSSDFLDSISSIQSKYESLLSAQKEFNESGAITASTLKTLMDNNLLQYLQFTENGLSLNTQALENEEQALKDEATAKLYSAMCNDIQNLSLDDTTKLSPIAQTALKNLDEAATTAGKNAAISAQGWWEYGASIQSIPGVSGLTGDNQKKAQAIIKQYQNIARSINSISVGKTATSKSSSASKSAGKTMEDIQKQWKEYLDKYLAMYKAELDAGLIDFNTYLNKSRSLLDEYYRDGKISAKDYWDSVKSLYENQLSIYDKVLSAVTRRIEKEVDGIQDIIDGLEEQNDALQKQLDEYDSILSVVDDVYEKQIQALEDEKELLQDKIDAINDTNDALDLQYRKEQAIIALKRAQEQRTKKVFNGKEFVYSTDQNAIRDAQQTLQDIKTEELINNLEKEQEGIDAEIEKLQEYKEKWQEITSAKETEQNKQLAIALWGQDYERFILQNRISDIESFKNNYVSIQKQIENNQGLIDSYSQKVDYYNKLKEQWTSITDAYKQAQEDQYATMVLGAQWESDVLSGRINVLNNFKNQYIAIQQAITNAALEAARAQALAAQSVSTSSSSGNTSTGSSNVSQISKPQQTKSFHVVQKVGSGYSTQSRAEQKIDRYNGDGVFWDGSNNKWYVFKNKNYSDTKFSTYDEAIKSDIYKKAGSLRGVAYYASGTSNAKKGLNLVGEAGTETYIDNDGNISLVTKPSLIEMEGGEIVKNAKETQNLLNPDNLVPIKMMEFPGINGKTLKLSTDEFMDKVASVMPNYSSMVQSAIQMPKYDFTPVSRDNSTSVSIGEIHLHEVNNVDSLANAIIRELPSKISQKLGQ